MFEFIFDTRFRTLCLVKSEMAISSRDQYVFALRVVSKYRAEHEDDDRTFLDFKSRLCLVS